MTLPCLCTTDPLSQRRKHRHSVTGQPPRRSLEQQARGLWAAITPPAGLPCLWPIPFYGSNSCQAPIYQPPPSCQGNGGVSPLCGWSLGHMSLPGFPGILLGLS